QNVVTEGPLLLGQRLAHRRRAVLVDFGRQQSGPPRFPISGLLHDRDARAKRSEIADLRIAIAKRKQRDIEFLRHLAYEVVDPHRTAMRERIRQIRREHRHAAAAFLTRTTLYDPVSLRNN